MQVLIETLWNVNSGTAPAASARSSCFNRNIVECKLAFSAVVRALLYSFNRNIVECKCWTPGRKATDGL